MQVMARPVISRYLTTGEAGTAMNFLASLIAICIGAVLATIFMLAWSRQQRRETDERQRTGQQLKDLHLLLEHAADGILRIDLHGRFTATHDQWARRFGWTAEEIVGKHWRELLHPHDAGRIEAALARVEEHPIELEVRTWHKNGHETHQRLTIFHSRDESGQRTGYEWLCKDITESKQIEENLRLQKALFQAVSEASAEGILVISGEGKIICFNQRLIEMFALEEKSLRIGDRADRVLCEIFQRGENSSAHLARFARLSDATEQQDDDEIHLHDRVFHLFTAPLQGESLPVNGRAWFFRDVTDKRRITEQLSQARDTADAANRAKSTFLANVSHEIRTPMTAVLGYAELMIVRCESVDPQLTQWAQTIHRGAHRLVLLMNEILELSKIEAGRMTIEPASCRGDEIIQEIVELLKPQADEQRISVGVEYADDAPRNLYTDPNRLRQILTNLIGNAIKFTERGSVRIVASAAGSHLCVDVIDTGTGMNAEEQSQLFQLFAQTRKANDPACHGAGLGLAISRRLARLLGGDIYCESDSGVGSRFTLTIESSLAAEPSAQNNLPSPNDELRNITGARVLVADDVPMIRDYLSTLLEEAGAMVVTCEDGLAAVQTALCAAADGQAFDVILMDMQMPLLDGYGATRNLRLSGYTGAIVALTASVMEADRKRCIEAGCDIFESKPINRATLIGHVAQYAAKRAQREAA
jgi:PAS domain S-box-containing protein